MKVFLIRHGAAHDPSGWPRDADRPLTDAGRAAFERLVRASGLPSKVDVLAASPYVRAQQTAAILAGALRWPRPELWPQLQPDGKTSQAIQRLAALPASSSVALVTHQPLVGRLLLSLAENADEAEDGFRPGSIAFLETQDPRRPGRLHWVRAP